MFTPIVPIPCYHTASAFIILPSPTCHTSGRINGQIPPAVHLSPTCQYSRSRWHLKLTLTLILDRNTTRTVFCLSLHLKVIVMTLKTNIWCQFNLICFKVNSGILHLPRNSLMSYVPRIRRIHYTLCIILLLRAEAMAVLFSALSLG